MDEFGYKTYDDPRRVAKTFYNLPKKAKWQKPIDDLMDQAWEILLAHIESEARSIMRKHRNLTEYVQGMGTWFFVDARREKYGQECVDESDLAYLYSFWKIFDDYDEAFHITGWPMRFTADGPVINNW